MMDRLPAAAWGMRLAVQAAAVALRVVLGALGVVDVALGIRGLTKLDDSNLDSPMWMFALLGLVSLLAGCYFLWFALRGMKSRRRSDRTTDQP